MLPVTLQISLAPSDYLAAKHILPHQVAIWRRQVSEILITVDLHRSAGRFGDDWDLGRREIISLAASVVGARVVEVDYDAHSMASVSREFFGGCPVPKKDHRGGPYFSYFFGLHASHNPYVLHCDADMIFGGGSQTWLAEAVSLLESTPSVFVVAPFPGPPAANGQLAELNGERMTNSPFSYKFSEMSSRVFLIDRRRFASHIGALRPALASWRGLLLALLDGNPPRELPERLLTRAMARHQLTRVDFLGGGTGMWSLHPPYRCADFYAKLSVIINRVASGDLPSGQLGYHDINDSLVDWSEARAKLTRRRWWRRLAARITI